jgi:hypothetical protein
MPKTQIVTPVMTFQWAKVFDPQEPLEAGKSREWSITGLMDANDPACLDFVTRLETEFQTLNGAGAKIDKNGWPFGEEIDKESGAPTGSIQFKFKRKETSNKGNILPPPVIVDAKRQPWPADTLIGNGSTGKIAFDPYGWDSPTVRGAKGMSLWLNMVQVINLVPYERATPEDTFEEEEGTSFAPAAPETPFAEEPPAAPMSMAERLKQRSLQVAAEAQELPSDEDVPF